MPAWLTAPVPSYPYAVDKALARPYLPRWIIADLIGTGRGRALPAKAGAATGSRATPNSL